MAYRKTETVAAMLNGKRQLIVGAATDVISRDGLDGVNLMASTAARAKIAAAGIYRHFPDRDELLAAVIASRLARDQAAIRSAAAGLEGFAEAIAVFYTSIPPLPLARVLIASSTYSEAMRGEIAHTLRGINELLLPRERLFAAAGALGALFAMRGQDSAPKKNAAAASLFVLRAIGVPDARARGATDARHRLPA